MAGGCLVQGTVCIGRERSVKRQWLEMNDRLHYATHSAWQYYIYFNLFSATFQLMTSQIALKYSAFLF